MNISVVKHIVLNLCVLVTISHLVTKTKLIQSFYLKRSNIIKSEWILILFFGGMGILSTYLGIPIRGAIANTRAVSILAAVLLFGPNVGFGAGLIAGVHRYLFFWGDFTGLPCAISTVMAAVIGAVFYKKIEKDNRELNYPKIALIGALSELVQMIIILLLAKPFSDAWGLVQVIGLPMIIMNSFGVCLVMNVIHSNFRDLEETSAEHIDSALKVADACIPYLSNGLESEEDLLKVLKEIVEQTKVQGAIFFLSDREVIYGEGFDFKPSSLNKIKKSLNAQIHNVGVGNYKDTRNQYVGSAIKENEEKVAILCLVLEGDRPFIHSNIEFVEGLGKIISTQLDLRQLQLHKDLLEKADMAMLQAQINPHFLFNILATIIAISRSDIDKSRKLLQTLSIYFRQALDTQDVFVTLDKELEFVKTYIELEKARFEEKLEVEINNEIEEDILVPRYCIQPLVENAIKHGIQKTTNHSGKVEIKIRELNNWLQIKVIDNGIGIVEDPFSNVSRDKRRGIGLTNLKNRLEYLYHDVYKLDISSNKGVGTTVLIELPKRGEINEDSLCR